MTQLQFSTTDNKEIGVFNWFAVHGTALNNSVRLISGDNKGAACQLLEKHMHRQREPDQVFNRSSSAFIAAFAQEASGDVSPNIMGTFCQDTGLPCVPSSSTCNGRNELCHGHGPGWPDCFRSSYIIAQKQFLKAKELLSDTNPIEVIGDIDFRSIFVNMSECVLIGPESTETTCRPAMGYSFAAGTTDGPGMFDFVQGQTEHSPFWRLVSSMLYRSSERQNTCQQPKPVLLDTGEMEFPMPWQPEILQLQIMRIGQVVIVNIPGEVTTMSGKRLRSTIEAKVKGHWGQEVEVIISGITNGYSSYITTNEEYRVQRYEGASTIFGPRTLEAFMNEFEKLAEDMVQGVERESTVHLPDYVDQQWSFSIPVLLDSVPLGREFGQVTKDIVKNCYSPGETVEVEFWSANPRNSQQFGGHSFVAIDRHSPSTSSWLTIGTDDDLSTIFEWRSCLGTRLMPCSTGRISWTIEDDAVEGVYRIAHSGHAKSNLLSPQVNAFTGHTTVFQVRSFCPAPATQNVIV